MNRWQAAFWWCCAFLILAGAAFTVGVFAGTVVSLLYAFLFAVYLGFIPVIKFVDHAGGRRARMLAVALNILCVFSAGAIFCSSTTGYLGLAYWCCFVAFVVWKSTQVTLPSDAKPAT